MAPARLWDYTGFFGASQPLPDPSPSPERSSTNTSLERWVKLNVGGRKFFTTVDTLTKEPGSLLEKMFCGTYRCDQMNGEILLARDGKYFAYILRWLRDGVMCNLHPRMYPEFLLEAEFYQLQGLITAIEEILDHNTVVSRKQVMRAVILGNKSFTGSNFWAEDLSGLELQHADFRDAILHYVSFEGSDLSQANLRNCQCRYGKLSNAVLQGSIMCNADFRGTSLVGGNLQNANIEWADLTGADLRDANLFNAKMGKVKMSPANYIIAFNSGAILY